MRSFTLILVAALLFAKVALGDEPQGPLHHRPFSDVWVIFDDDCTDLYNLDAAGLAPPGGADSGANGLDSTGSWNTLPDAYNLQANIGAPHQVSGDPDGLCDDAPETIEGNLTIGADQDLHIGPIVFPKQGAYFLYDWDAIVLDYSWGMTSLVPWDTGGIVEWDWWALDNQTSLTSNLRSVGPHLNSTSQMSASDETGIPAMPVYISLFLDNAGAWQVNAAFVPYRLDKYGKAD
jgi:hypothetical protein